MPLTIPMATRTGEGQRRQRRRPSQPRTQRHTSAAARRAATRRCTSPSWPSRPSATTRWPYTWRQSRSSPRSSPQTSATS
eukprot:2329163-Lingulodinium_polyedra.AAC.1